MIILSQSSINRFSTFFLLYLVQGIPAGFAFTTIVNYLAAQGLEARALSTFGVVVGLPWGIKFIWGPLIDSFQTSTMGKRKPWVLLSQCMAFFASLSMLTINNPVSDFNLLIATFTVLGICMSLQDVSTDAMAILVVPPSERGRINAYMRGGSATGQAIGAAGLAYMLHHSGFQMAALVQSTLIFMLTILVFFVKERPQDKWLSIRQVVLSDDATINRSLVPLIKKVGQAILTTQSLLLFGVIATIFICTSLFQRVYILHLIQKLGWNDLSVSVLSGTYGTFIAIGLALFGGSLSDRIGARRMFFWTVLCSGIFHLGFALSAILWPNTEVATIGIIVRQTLEIIYGISVMPIIMHLCKRGIEGSQFSIYMALINQADVLGIYLSGILFSIYSASTIGIICGFIMLSAATIIKNISHQKNSDY